jgi:hypothetical protein
MIAMRQSQERRAEMAGVALMEVTMSPFLGQARAGCSPVLASVVTDAPVPAQGHGGTGSPCRGPPPCLDGVLLARGADVVDDRCNAARAWSWAGAAWARQERRH